MIKIENTETYGWEAAIRGMRNPMNSWARSDSDFDIQYYDDDGHELEYYPMVIGEDDYDLMQRLAAAGPVHAKYRRMITVTCDITAPLYWWKEFDTYKIGTVANSCSTMHKIHAKEFTLDDFSHEHLFDDQSGEVVGLEYLTFVIGGLNKHRNRYLTTKNKDEWWQMIQLLPSSYNQRRTVQLNYEVLVGMYRDRHNHKLDEWRTLCAWIESLKHSELITGATS